MRVSKRLTAVLTAALMVLCALAPFEGGLAKDSVTVTASAQAEYSYLLPRSELTVSESLAESYGFSDGAEGVTALDVLVREHEVMFGDDFTAATAGNYLEVSSSYGYTVISKIFGVETSNLGFTINGATPHDDVYGDYGYTGYGVDEAAVADGDTVEFFIYQDGWAMDCYSWFELGGVKTEEISAAANEEIELALRGYSIGWYGCYTDEMIEDYTTGIDGAQLVLIDADGNAQSIDGAVCGENGEVTVSFVEDGEYILSAVGDEYTYIIMPWCEITVGEGSGEPSADPSAEPSAVASEEPSAAPAEGDDSITVPEGAELFVGYKEGAQTAASGGTHYKPFVEVGPLSRTENDGTVTYTYDLTDGNYYNLRVTMGGKVTYADIFKAREGGTSLTVSEDRLRDASAELEIADGYFENNIYVNADKAGTVSLEAGGQFQIVALRNWQIINATAANYFVEPDFHYAVSYGNSASVSEDGVITALGEGVSIVTVTYDPLTAYALGSAGSDLAESALCYGGIAPANTGVIVVCVGDSGAAYEDAELDAEFDRVYYLAENGGAEYTFTPESGAEISVCSPTFAGGVADYSGGFSKDGVTENADGSVTLLLTEGRNVIRSEIGGTAAYFVVTASPITYTVTADTEDGTVNAGDSVTLTFDGLSHPVQKLAGLYNFSAQLNLLGEDGTEFSGAAAQYDFITAGNSVTITVPEDWQDDSFAISGGSISVSGWGSDFGAHRAVTYDEGISPNLAADWQSGVFSILPEIEISLGAKVTTVNLRIEGSEKNIFDGDISVAQSGDVTVEDVLAAAASAGLDIEMSDSYYGGKYVASIEGESEGHFGGYDGWVFRVNGYSPDYGISYVFVENGDEILLCYGDYDILYPEVDTSRLNSDGILKFTSSYTSWYQDESGEWLTETVSVPIDGAAVTWGYAQGKTAEYTTDENGEVTIASSRLTNGAHKVQIEKHDESGKALVIRFAKDYTVTVSGQSSSSSGGSSSSSSSGTVYFTLKGDTVHAEGEHTAFSTWISKTRVSLADCTTVGDLFKKVLDENGYTYSGLEDGYITSITSPSGVTLAEFTNGVYSGWMYTVNGTHPDVGLNDYVLKSGDAVVWHYTDDYTAETDTKQSASSGGSSGSSSGGSSSSSSGSSSSRGDASADADDADSADSTDGAAANLGGAAVFTDVPEEHWASEYIYELAEIGVINGHGDGTFGPDDSVTRAELLALIARLGDEELAAKSAFADVDADEWYAGYVAWGAENGIVNGVSESEFAPDEPVTRQDAAVMLTRYLAYKNIELSGEDETEAFADGGEIADYALEAVYAMKKAGVLSGREDNNFVPNDTATRAEISKIISVLSRSVLSEDAE